MKTNTIIEYGVVDVTAKKDSTLSANDIQSFSQLSNLKKDKLPEKKYSTFEKNFFILDGQCDNMQSTINDVGLWTSSMSDSQGDFTTPPVLTITFSQAHTSPGLTLTFSQYSYCNNLKIQYYDLNNTLLSEKTFAPDNYEYFCEDLVENYGKIVITFYSTNIPYRYLKLYKLMYGNAILFNNDDIASCNILEQFNVISDELSINTLEFIVFSEDDRFNILNPQGIYSTIQQGQELKVYQEKNNILTNMGVYYIDKWESIGNNKMQFTAVDIVGLLDRYDFKGKMYDNGKVGTTVFSIMQQAGLLDLYTLETALGQKSLVGYIPRCTCREALQKVLFASGGVAKTSRNGILELKQIALSESPIEISRSDIFKGSETIKKGDVYTAVLIKSHNYKADLTQQKTVYSNYLEPGTYTVEFDEPYYLFSCNGATKVSGTTYTYVTFRVDTAGNVTVAAYPYIDSTHDVLVVNSTLVGNEKENILYVESLEIANDSNSADIGQRILDYYNNQYESEFEKVLEEENVADNVLIQEPYGNELDGFITELDIDLTRGYVTKCKTVAKVSGS